MIKIKNNLFNKILFFGCIIIIPLSLFFPELKISSWLALITGIVYTLFLGNPFEGKTNTFTSNLLKTSVVFIGFGYPISSISELTISEFSYVIIFVVFALIIGYFLSKILNVERKTSDLISSGTAICGASAIAAIASSVKANEKQISISLGTVFILSVSGLIFYPSVGKYLALSDHQFGIWSGLTIHDTASAMGTAYDFSPNSLKIATVIKLAKVLFIVPIVFFYSFIYKEGGKKIQFPIFIIFFLFAMILNSLNPQLEIFSLLKDIGKKGLQISLFLIGTNLSLKNLKSIGFKPFIYGLVIWSVLSTISLIAIKYFS
tara:strand:- start:416 stop:1369 length:954 start_codon:yes stop_codon:yes gene_type:complete